MTAVLVAGVLAVGCGSDDGGDVTKAEFIERADAICERDQKEVVGKFRRYGEQNGAGTRRFKFEDHAGTLFSSIVRPIFQEQIKELMALDPPDGEEREVAAIFDAMQTALDRGKSEPAAFLLTEESFGEAPRLARAYGLTFCPNDP